MAWTDWRLAPGPQQRPARPRGVHAVVLGLQGSEGYAAVLVGQELAVEVVPGRSRVPDRVDAVLVSHPDLVLCTPQHPPVAAGDHGELVLAPRGGGGRLPQADVTSVRGISRHLLAAERPHRRGWRGIGWPGGSLQLVQQRPHTQEVEEHDELVAGLGAAPDRRVQEVQEGAPLPAGGPHLPDCTVRRPRHRRRRPLEPGGGGRARVVPESLERDVAARQSAQGPKVLPEPPNGTCVHGEHALHFLAAILHEASKAALRRHPKSSGTHEIASVAGASEASRDGARDPVHQVHDAQQDLRPGPQLSQGGKPVSVHAVLRAEHMEEVHAPWAALQDAVGKDHTRVQVPRGDGPQHALLGYGRAVAEVHSELRSLGNSFAQRGDLLRRVLRNLARLYV
mmetsp:Transcript_102041/g.304484  ORF Transcript_102041/g.304484 Transcript_102041/m.304484 type:complete len:395 (-) Transcript_102041:640-1824(-)